MNAAPATEVAGRLTRQAVELTRALRAQGVRVGPAQTAVFLEALTHVRVTRRADVYAAARATLTTRAEEDAALQAAFALVFGGPAPAPPPAVTPPRQTPPAQVGLLEALRARVEGEERPLADKTGSTSGHVIRARRHFEYMTDAELREAERAVARLTWRPAQRRTRRARTARHGRVDARATLRAARATLGEPLQLVHRAPRRQPRPLLVLIDVSGSMERYTRVLLVLAHGLLHRARLDGGRAEVFAFGTHPVRITRALGANTPDAALRAVQGVTHGWAGGTRIGASLHQLLREQRAFLPRGAITLVFSDGLDTGDPRDLKCELRHLKRRSKRVTWCSPLVGTRGYAPVQRAVRAALPLVDDFVGAGSVRHLADLVNVLNGVPARAEPPTSRAARAQRKEE